MNTAIMNTAMEQKINRVMTEMGNSLASIALAFSREYKDLVDASNEIIRYANNQRNR